MKIGNKKCIQSCKAGVRCGFAVMLLMAFVITLAACGGEKKSPLTDATYTVPTISVDTVHGKLAFPEALAENMRHQEVTEGSVSMEIFYMVLPRGEFEVYRVYFGDASVGIPLGYLVIDEREIPVTYAINDYTEEDFPDKEEIDLYYSMMDGFSVVLQSIYKDTRFSENKAIEPVAVEEVKLRYWDVVLPGNVMFEETMEGGNYRVDFYGEVSGERIDLYYIGLGEMQADTKLGMYIVDGVQKPVMVKSYSMAEYESWEKENKLVIYQMMESLNTVVQVIVADENFSEGEPAA